MKFDLSPYLGALFAVGDDAGKLLQSLTTCDIRTIGSDVATVGAFTNPKGRVLVLFHAVAIESGFALIVPREMESPAAQHLNGYRFRAKVKIETAGDRGLALTGSIAPEAGPEPGILSIGPNRFLQFTSDAAPADPNAWSAWRRSAIAAGIPEVVAATSGKFLPQNLNLAKLGGLSFSKGCYPGQEVIARTEHLGSLKRCLVRAHASGESPSPGDELRVEGREAGTVVTVQTDSEQAGGEQLGSRQSGSDPSGQAGSVLLAVVAVELLNGKPILNLNNFENTEVGQIERL